VVVGVGCVCVVSSANTVCSQVAAAMAHLPQRCETQAVPEQPMGCKNNKHLHINNKKIANERLAYENYR